MRLRRDQGKDMDVEVDYNNVSNVNFLPRAYWI